MIVCVTSKVLCFMKVSLPGEGCWSEPPERVLLTGEEDGDLYGGTASEQTMRKQTYRLHSVRSTALWELNLRIGTTLSP